MHPRFLFKLALVLGVQSPLVLIISVAAKCVQWSTVQLAVQLYTVQPVPAGGRCQRVQCPQPSVKPAVTRGGRYSGEQTRHFCLRPSLAASGAVCCCQHSQERPWSALARRADTRRMLHDTVPAQLTASVRSDTNEITAIHDSMILARMDFTDGSSSFWRILINILDLRSGDTRENC